MKILVYSDLHLEFAPFQPNTEAIAAAEVVVLAGDIHVGVKGVQWAMSAFKNVPVVYVAGNHEYWKHTYPGLIAKMKTTAQGSSVHVLENESLEIAGVHFYGCTGWTDFNLFGDPRIAGHHAQEYMGDFKKIRREPGFSKLRSLDAAMIHKRSIQWLTQVLSANKREKSVVVSHHAPSPESLLQLHREDILSAAYASDLSDLVKAYEPSLWIHGHTHNTSDYWIGPTRIMCNPRGYAPDQLNGAFNPANLVDI